MARTQRPKTPANLAIASRLLEVLELDLRLSVSEAARKLGYANATTLHKVRKGLALPDFSRVAKFAENEGRLTGRTMNLHYVLVGKGPRVVPYAAEPKSTVDQDDVDFINLVKSCSRETKGAIRVLLRGP